MTTIIEQYVSIKAKYNDAVLLFCVGDFYETFNEDAKILSEHLGLLLVVIEDHPYIKAVASLSHLELGKALHTLVKAGHKVALCEELETRKQDR